MDAPYTTEVFVLSKHTLQWCCGEGEMHEGHGRKEVITPVLRPAHHSIAVSAQALQVTPEPPLPWVKVQYEHSGWNVPTETVHPVSHLPPPSTQDLSGISQISASVRTKKKTKNTTTTTKKTKTNQAALLPLWFQHQKIVPGCRFGREEM